MTGKTEVWRGGADPGIEVIDTLDWIAFGAETL